MKFSIAMTTYNGEKYCLEQLKSLTSQDHKPCEIVIGDDGSQDKTIQMIEDFATTTDIPVKLIRNNPGLGFAKNFFNVLMNCDGEWVCFCDQDDFWFRDKIKKAEEAINKNKNINVVFQNSYICDHDLKNQGTKFPNRIPPGHYAAENLPGAFGWPGFLQTIRREPFQAFLKSSYEENSELEDCCWKCMVAHDYWVAVISSAIGGVEVLSEPVALYRRHDQTVTGDYITPSIKERLGITKNTRSAQYAKKHAFAIDNAAYLKWLASKQKDEFLLSQLLLAASRHERLAEIYRLRLDVCSERAFKRRISSYLKILIGNGYYRVSRDFYQSLKDAIKDLGVILKFIR